MAYLFTSTRLGFRNWQPDDRDAFQEVNGDPEVMRHFPATLSPQETADFLHRLVDHYEKHGFTYYVVIELATGELIGFTGLARQEYPAPFTPCVDIGWRLKRSAWGQGFATEAAAACLEHARHQLELKEVYAVAVTGNSASIRVMEKLGMEYALHFFHPKLKDHPELEKCVVYKIELT